MKKNTDFAAVLRKKLAADPQLAAAVEDENFGADVAEKIFTARTERGMTQQELAERIGTSQSAVARMEDADCGSYTYKTLRKIADAFGVGLRVEFYAKPEWIPNSESKPSIEAFGASEFDWPELQVIAQWPDSNIAFEAPVVHEREIQLSAAEA